MTIRCIKTFEEIVEKDKLFPSDILLKKINNDESNQALLKVNKYVNVFEK